MSKTRICTLQKSNNILPAKLIVICFSALFSACSFVELNPAARHIIYANNQDNCRLIKHFDAEVATEMAFIDRTELAIAEELQVLAQNAAFEARANAIWPETDVEEGKQRFKLLWCDH